MAETWRVVLASGEVREGALICDGAYVSVRHEGGLLVSAKVREILAPGELTRAELVEMQRRIEAGEVEAALRDRVEGALVAAHGDVDRAAEALGWTAAALEMLLADHPHWWPREELGPRG